MAFSDPLGHRRNSDVDSGSCSGNFACEVDTVGGNGLVHGHASGTAIDEAVVRSPSSSSAAVNEVQSSHNVAVINSVTIASGAGRDAVPASMNYDLAMKAQEYVEIACADGADGNRCHAANLWAAQSRAASRPTTGCSAGFSQVAFGSNWCNGIGRAELGWNFAVLGSWFIGGRELTAAGQGGRAVTGGRMVIGEDMNRVRAAASANDASVYNASAGALRRGDRAIMAENRAWIRARMRAGDEILDIGPAPGRMNYPIATSDFYMMERDEIWRAAHPLYRPLY